MKATPPRSSTSTSMPNKKHPMLGLGFAMSPEAIPKFGGLNPQLGHLFACWSTGFSQEG